MPDGVGTGHSGTGTKPTLARTPGPRVDWRSQPALLQQQQLLAACEALLLWPATRLGAADSGPPTGTSA